MQIVVAVVLALAVRAYSFHTSLHTINHIKYTNNINKQDVSIQPLQSIRQIQRFTTPYITYTSSSFALCAIPPSSPSSDEEKKEPTMFDQVASKGLAGILAITAAEAIFWALGVPLAALYYKVTSGEWIDLATTDGQLKAAGFSFGYGGFATVILQYRVTLFAIPLVPIMEKYVVEPGKKIMGEKFGEPTSK